MFLRVAGVEVKMERHLLGRPHNIGKMGFLINTPGSDKGVAFEETLSAKDRRMRQMLMEELVDPDRQGLMTVKKQKNKIPARTATNTLDLREKELEEAQTLTSSYFERCLDNQVVAVYLNHGTGKIAEASKFKLRQWLKKHPFVKTVGAVPLEEAFSIVELDFDEDD